MEIFARGAVNLSASIGLAVSIGAYAESGCGSWSTDEFFRAAKVVEVVWCLNAGADPNARTEDGVTVLHWAAVSNENPWIIAALVDAGAEF